MANSMYIPLRLMPSNLTQVKKIITDAFIEFDEMVPTIKFESNLKHDEGLLKGFVMIEGESLDMQCWISFSECPVEISERPGYNYIAAVKTRGNWYFAGIVSYGLCKFGGYAVLNDAGELDGQTSYTPESLQTTLRK